MTISIDRLLAGQATQAAEQAAHQPRNGCERVGETATVSHRPSPRTARAGRGTVVDDRRHAADHARHQASDRYRAVRTAGFTRPPALVTVLPTARTRSPTPLTSGWGDVDVTFHPADVIAPPICPSRPATGCPRPVAVPTCCVT